MTTWRFVPFRYYNPYYKSALNDAALEAVADGADPVIWLSGWSEDCINVGRGQTVSEEVDLDAVRDRGISIVRRQGGGGTTYLTRRGEITWHQVVPADMLPADPNQVYEQVCGRVVDALNRLGIEAWHEPVNDVVTAQGKVSGATLRREDGAVYVAGTLLYDTDIETMFTLLTPGEDKLADKDIEDVRDRVATVRDQCEATFDDAREALRDAFTADRDVREAAWTDAETHTAKERMAHYESDDWIFQEGSG